MLIGLLSDTHIGYPSMVLPPHIKGAWRGVDLEELPPEVLEPLRGVDLILHAGDIYIPSVLDQLEAIAPVLAAWGDDDLQADFGNDKRMMKRHIMVLDGVTIWLSHVRPRYELVDPVEEAYFFADAPEDPEDYPDIIIFGHTHIATIENNRESKRGKEVLFVNPGSATFPDYKPRLGSVGLLTISSGKMEPRLVMLDETQPPAMTKP